MRRALILALLVALAVPWVTGANAAGAGPNREPDGPSRFRMFGAGFGHGLGLSQWGAYGLANVTYFLDSDHNFHVGTTGQFISASLHGDAVGATPAIDTKDHWVSISFEFGFSF